MIVYCDRLTARSCAYVLMLRRRAGVKDELRVCMLDDASSSGTTHSLIRTLRRAGVTVELLDFKAGRLRTAAGEGVPFAAAAAANRLAFSAARQLITGSPTLTLINARWTRNTVQLYIAKTLWSQLLQLCMRIKVTEVLAREAKSRPCLVLHLPSVVDGRWLQEEFENVDLHWCAETNGRAESAAELIGVAIRACRATVRHLVRRKMANLPDGSEGRSLGSKGPASATPYGVLILQQDDLGTDRSYRTQPHWMLPEITPPTFRTFVLQKSYVRRTHHNVSELREEGIFLLGNPLGYALKRVRSSQRLLRSLRQDIAACLLRAATSRNVVQASAFSATAGLLARSWVLAKLCSVLNIKAFLSAEGFLVETDAMNIVAPSLGVATISYQYSNLSRNCAVMMTTSDTMLTFSEAYDPVWTRNDIRPVRTIANGYVFDSSFHLLRKRAADLRDRLEVGGARFVVCFFDETVEYDKYGVIDADQHNGELLSLLRMVTDDLTFGLVVKTQYCRNTPSQLLTGHPVLEAALASGRYIELVHGTHRNTAFAAEAALIADIAIGSAIGATASLEAALAGCRSIMVNSYGLTGSHDHVYALADIVFPSLPDALGAVQRYRERDPAYDGLGDWAPILEQFDPFRDGNAGRRIRLLLDELTKATKSSDTFGVGNAGDPRDMRAVGHQRATEVAPEASR